MTRVSRKPLRKNLEVRLLEVFKEAFLCCRTKEEIWEFLDDFLSPAEKVMLSKRLGVVLLSEKGWRYDQISEALKTSSTTVNSIKGKLLYGAKGYHRVARAILAKEEFDKTFENLLVDVTSFLSPSGASAITRGLKKAAQMRKRSKNSLRDIL